MSIKSEALGRNLTPEEEKQADTNQDGKVSEEELKAFEDEQGKGGGGGKVCGTESKDGNDGPPKGAPAA